MKKTILLILILCICLFVGCGQTAKTAEKEDSYMEVSDSDTQSVITVIAPKSPATIPILSMIENNSLGNKIQIDLKLYSDMGKMMALISDGDYEILVAPVHAAANLYNKGLDVKLVSVFNWGGIYLSTTNPNCNDWEDLEGKEVYVPNKGSVPDVLTQYFLEQYGLTIGENVKIVYSSHAEIAQLIATGAVKYAIDVQPFVASNEKNVEGYKIISEFSKEWKVTQGKQYAMPGFCTVANSGYLNKNEKLVINFNEKFEEAIDWSLNNMDEAGAMANIYLNANAELIAEAMKSFCFDYKSANERESVEQYYRVLLNLKPESIGSVMPKESFYYSAK